MDEELCLSEEPGSVGCDGDRGFLEIVYKKFDYSSEADISALAPIYWDYYKCVNEEELNGFIEFEVCGEKVRCHKIESKFNELKFHNAEIMMAMIGDECVAFGVYHLFCECVAYVRTLYTVPSLEGNGVIKGLMNAIRPIVKKVIFQTRKQKVPENAIRLTEKHAKQIHETEYFKTFEMDWKGI